MCNGVIREPVDPNIETECPYKNRCHRCLACADEHWQSYLAAPYKNGYCTMFWDERYGDEKGRNAIEIFNALVQRNIGREERAGQAVFNAAHEMLPALADRYRDCPLDPFYHDERVTGFVRVFFSEGSILKNERV